VAGILRDAGCSSSARGRRRQLFPAGSRWAAVSQLYLERTDLQRRYARVKPDRPEAERYLSWLSLLPLRLNPLFTGR